MSWVSLNGFLFVKVKLINIKGDYFRSVIAGHKADHLIAFPKAHVALTTLTLAEKWGI